MFAPSVTPDALLLFLTAMVGSAILTPLAMRIARHLGLIDRPASHKFHRHPTPYLGGLAVAGSVLVIVVASSFSQSRIPMEALAIVLGGAAVSAIGLVDDWLTIRPLPRLAVQSLAAVGLWMVGIRLGPTDIMLLDLLVTILAVVAITNAVNLLDNMDGLSTGTVAIVSFFSFVAASWEGQHLVSIMAIVLCGACLGFLPYNFSPARIFLGDAGTLFMGFLVAAMLIKVDLPGYPLVTRLAVPILILAVPLFDTTLVMISRARYGRPLFRGSTDHSSHRLVALGASPRQAAMVTYGASFLSGTLALTLLRVDRTAVTWGVVGATVAAGLLLVWMLERVKLAGGPARAEIEVQASR
jgi:UDP-GlcNAc:undecaprenyl-phosphate GlcNAc-1-phosphate transferase